MKEQKKTKYFFSQYAYHQFYSFLFFSSSGGGGGHFEGHTGDTEFVLERSLNARLLSTVITS